MFNFFGEMPITTDLGEPGRTVRGGRFHKMEGKGEGAVKNEVVSITVRATLAAGSFYVFKIKEVIKKRSMSSNKINKEFIKNLEIRGKQKG